MNAQERRPVFSPKLVFGFAVIAVGLIFLADRLRWYDAWHLLAWWPLVLAVYGLARLWQDGPLCLGGHVWLAAAVAGYVSQFGPWGLLDQFWPVFLVWGGLVVTLRAIFPQPRRGKCSQPTSPSPGPADSCDPESDPTQVKP